MAVYYKWIKGCASGASLSSGLWTYLKWGSKGDYFPRLYAIEGKPEVENNIGTEEWSGQNLGHILTDGELCSPTISGSWTFNGKAIFNQGQTQFKDSIYFVDDKGNIAFIRLISARLLKFFNSLTTEGFVDIGGYLTVFGDLTVSGDSLFKKTITIKNKTNTANIITTGYCEAEYFNATSDKRAKENIQPATYSALDLISKLPVYTFNYKNKDETVTGILAQDLLEAQPKELDLVSNINATGENNDYMSIKNDKLMFVLMKAIQEQQQQIEALKEEIKQLKA